ncbi:hypothetical protein FQZ97_572810 [compost metagenome]
MSEPNVKPQAGMRMADRPASPPNTPFRCGASACSSSASASVIIEKYTPARMVANQPATRPNSRPATPPASGIRGVGSRPAPPSAFMAWMVANVPTPKYAAWPKDSMPPWPASRLKAQANSAAISICTAATSWPGGSSQGSAHSAATQRINRSAPEARRVWLMPVLPSGPRA